MVRGDFRIHLLFWGEDHEGRCGVVGEIPVDHQVGVPARDLGLDERGDLLDVVAEEAEVEHFDPGCYSSLEQTRPSSKSAGN